MFSKQRSEHGLKQSCEESYFHGGIIIVDVDITSESPFLLKYVGSTDVKEVTPVCTRYAWQCADVPCIVSDMVDQGVIIADGRYNNSDCWEGAATIISPTIPAGTNKTYEFTDPELSPANPLYEGQLIVDFSGDEKTARIIITKFPPVVYFFCSRKDAVLHEENWGIHETLPAVVELPNTQIVDYQFQVYRNAAHWGPPHEDPEEGIMLFVLRAGIGDDGKSIMECLNVNGGAEGCNCSMDPGVVVQSASDSWFGKFSENRVVFIHAPVSDWLSHIPDIQTAANTDDWVTTKAFLTSSKTGALWWKLSRSDREKIAVMAIKNTYFSIIRYFSNDGGATYGSMAGPCVPNRFIRYMKFGVPFDHWSDYYWKYAVDSEAVCYVPSEYYWLPVVAVNRPGHAMAAIQVREGFDYASCVIIFQYNGCDLQCGSWQIPENKSDITVYQAALLPPPFEQISGNCAYAAITQTDYPLGTFDICSPPPPDPPAPISPEGGVYTDLVPVVSSNLKAVGWASLYGTPWLEVEFLSGSLYGYMHVPESVYDALLAAPSKGKYFWKNIRCKTTDCSGGGIPYPYYKLR